MASSPGRWPGVVAPRSMPGRKCTAPCAVYSENSVWLAVEIVRSPPASRELGAQDGPGGTREMLARQNSKPAMAAHVTRTATAPHQSHRDRCERRAGPRWSGSTVKTHQDM